MIEIFLHFVVLLNLLIILILSFTYLILSPKSIEGETFGCASNFIVADLILL